MDGNLPSSGVAEAFFGTSNASLLRLHCLAGDEQITIFVVLDSGPAFKLVNEALLQEAGLCERTHSTMDQTPSMLRKFPQASVTPLANGLTHAVERLSLGFDWVSPLDPQIMSKLASLGDGIAEWLPRKFEVSTSQVMARVGPVAADAPSSSADDDGGLFAVLFDDNKDQDAPFDVKHAEVIINNEGFTFSVYAKYDGWEKTKAQALELFSVFFDEIIKNVKLSSIEFRASNVFSLEGFTGRLDDVLDFECDSLPRHIFKADGLWHVDEGYFDNDHESESDKMLVNLNVSKVQDEEGRLLYVRTMHQYSVDSESNVLFSLAELFGKYEHLHGINKSLLATVLNKETAAAIGLVDEARRAI
ncbi:hypothetical protein LT699_10970 [Pseudomonas syringae pv. syringae]|uniref:hypothetical protein n=1 Tax=Pseudomonas syringae TaxID=317 RepID=UPI00200A1D6C|nr:hypothetical protein [Pseudomonas syringae]MCK9747115.1 hypothetical protein [Pseudomonas syringae pv. syringae]